MAAAKSTTPTSPRNHPTVTALHERWTRILGGLTGAPIGHEPPLVEGEADELHDAATALERQVATTPAATVAEVILKLKMAGCASLVSGCEPQLVDSAANDLRELDPRLPLNDG